MACALASCSPKEDSIPEPPLSAPLSRLSLGYGVISVSYTRIMSGPDTDSVSLGYVREKTVLKILERRLVRSGEKEAYWILTEGNFSGWLPEDVMDVYDTEEKAETAAGSGR